MASNKVKWDIRRVQEVLSFSVCILIGMLSFNGCNLIERSLPYEPDASCNQLRMDLDSLVVETAKLESASGRVQTLADLFVYNSIASDRIVDLKRQRNSVADRWETSPSGCKRLIFQDIEKNRHGLYQPGWSPDSLVNARNQDQERERIAREKAIAEENRINQKRIKRAEYSKKVLLHIRNFSKKVSRGFARSKMTLDVTIGNHTESLLSEIKGDIICRNSDDLSVEEGVLYIEIEKANIPFMESKRFRLYSRDWKPWLNDAKCDAIDWLPSYISGPKLKEPFNVEREYGELWEFNHPPIFRPRVR